MPAEFRWIMTALGLAKRAAAEAGGTPIDMRTSVFVVGDGNGAYHEPEAMLPAGVLHEVWRGAMNKVSVHPVEDNLMVCEALIPISAGPFDVREAHIEDAAGDVIAVGKYPMFSKPGPASGGARAEYVHGGFRISNGGATVLQIDNSLVMATQAYVDAHALLTNPHQATSAATVDRLMLRDANGRAKVAAPAAADDIARKDTVDAAIAALMNAPPAALDTLYELAAALGNDPNFATTMTTALAGKINHSLATAANDFLVAPGAGSFIKKTLAEVKAILGLGTAASLEAEQIPYGTPNSNAVTNWATGISNITKTGPYYIQTDLTGTPTNSSGFCTHVAHSDNLTYAVQYFTTTATDDLWMRHKTTTWNAWVKMQRAASVTSDATTFSGNYTLTPPNSAAVFFVAIQSSGASSSAGAMEVRWLNSGGGEIRTWTRVSGTNVLNGPDGASGMADLDCASIPVFDGTVTMEFRAYGGNGYSATVTGWLTR